MERANIAKEVANYIIDHLLARGPMNAAELESTSFDVARIESKSLELHFEEVMLDDLILNAIEEAKAQLTDQAVEIQYQPAGLIVTGDRERIFQVVSNLINNATKFTEAGIIYVRVEQNNDNEVLVTVRDSGSGIDRSMQPRLFTKFASRSEMAPDSDCSFRKMSLRLMVGGSGPKIIATRLALHFILHCQLGDRSARLLVTGNQTKVGK